MKQRLIFALACVVLFLTGCATVPPKDYTEFRKHPPKSLLVLPPLNKTTEVIASYSLLTTTTRPLSEMGYYVVPVALADRYMKENGLPTPAEMHQVPPAKLNEIFGADAVLYITVEKYGSKYMVLASNTVVGASAKLVDAKTGITLWENKVDFVLAGNSGLINALVEQVVNKLVDQAHGACYGASSMLFTTPNQGVLYGPHHPAAGNAPGQESGSAIVR